MKITDLKIVYGDGVKKEEFGAIKKAEAHLSAVLDDVDDAATMIEHVARLAIGQVNKMIGKAVTAAEGKLDIVTPSADEKPVNDKAKIAEKEAADAKAEKAEVVDKKKPGKEAKADKKADAAAVVEEPATEDPAAVEDTSTDASAVTDDDAGEVNFDLPEVTDTSTEITDADLNSHVQKKNAEIANPTAIRELIATYKTDPKKAFQLREIPQEKRQEFLDKLAELKKA